jgi:hypothetical protein
MDAPSKAPDKAVEAVAAATASNYCGVVLTR